jgi:hypothetical protein
MIGRLLAEILACTIECLRVLRDGKHDVIQGQDQGGGSWLITAVPAQSYNLHAI